MRIDQQLGCHQIADQRQDSDVIQRKEDLIAEVDNLRQKETKDV